MFLPNMPAYITTAFHLLVLPFLEEKVVVEKHQPKVTEWAFDYWSKFIRLSIFTPYWGPVSTTATNYSWSAILWIISQTKIEMRNEHLTWIWGVVRRFGDNSSVTTKPCEGSCSSNAMSCYQWVSYSWITEPETNLISKVNLLEASRDT